MIINYPILLTLVLCCTANTILAQENVKADKKRAKITAETITNVCPGLEHQKKTVVTVPRFNVTSPTKPDGQFGDNLATMLETALSGTNCFNVLSAIKNNAENEAEINFDKSGQTKGTTLQTGKMKVANVLVIGEVTKFEMSSTTKGIGVLSSKVHKALVGITIKLQNPETREIYIQQSFNAEKKVSGDTRLGVNVPIIGNIDLAKGSMQNPAVQEATEEAIYAAVEFIASQKEKLPLPSQVEQTVGTTPTLVVEHIEYQQLSELIAGIEKIKGVQKVDGDNFNANTATLVIVHTLKNKELVDAILLLESGKKLSVLTVNKEGAKLQMK